MAGLNPAMIIRIAATLDEFKRNLAEGRNQIETTTAAMAKLATSFSGDRLVQHAHNVAAAIQSVGGVTKLTAAEMDRANAVIQRAIDKYAALGKQAPTDLVNLANATKRADDSTKSWAQTLGGSFATQFKATLASFVSAAAIIGLVRSAWGALTAFVSSSIASYQNAEAAQRKLTTALVAQGTATPQTIKAFSDLATQFQKTTVFSDDLITEMQALLVQVGGVAPGEMQKALSATTNLASGLGIDLRSATMMVSKAFEDNFGALKKAGIDIDIARAKAEGMTYVLSQIDARFGGQAQAQAETYAGKIEQIANAWDNVKEAVGEVILKLPIVEAGLRLATEAADGMAAGGTDNVKSWGAFFLAMLDPTGGLPMAVIELNEMAKAANRAAAEARIARAAAIAAAEKGLRLKFGNIPAKTGFTSAFDFKPLESAGPIIARVASEVANLTKWQKENILAWASLGKGAKDVGEKVHATELAVTSYIAQSKLSTAESKELEAATKRAEAANKAFRDSVDRSIVSLYRYGSMTLPTVTSGYEMWIQRGIEANGLLQAGIPMWYGTAAATKAVGIELDSGTFNLNAWILGLKQIPPEQIKIKQSTEGLFRSMTGLFDALARLTGSAFIQWLGDVADATATAQAANMQLTQSLKDAGDNTAAQAGAWVQWSGQVVAAMDKATQSASKAKNALSGAATGAVAGSKFGWWGAAIGAIAGLFVGLAKGAKDSTEKMRNDFINSAGGLDVLKERAWLAGISLDRLFDSTRAEPLKNEIALITKQLEAWEARVAGLNKAAGGLGSMTAGFAAPFEAALAKLDELKQSLSGLTGKELFAARVAIKQLEKDLVVMAAKGQQQFTNLGTYALATFAGILKQTGSLSQAFDAVGPSIDALIKLQGSLGFTSSATVQALMDIRKVVTANQAVMQSVDGLNQVMAGLTAAGQINQALFTAFGQDATVLFAKLQAGGATGSQALALMQPTLQQLWQMQQTFGFAVDEGTQALLDQAVAQGIVGAKHKSVSDKMLEALLGIQGAVEALALVLTQGVGGALGDLGSRTRTNAGEWKTWGDYGVAQAIRIQRGLDAIELPDLTAVPGPAGGGGVPSSMSAQSSGSSKRPSGSTQSLASSTTIGDVHVHFGSGPSSVAQAEEMGFVTADQIIKILDSNTGGRRTKARKALRVA